LTSNDFTAIIKLVAIEAIFKTMNIANIPNKIVTFLKEVRIEMKKVNWPTRETTIRYTLIVVGISVIVAIYLGGLDLLFTALLNKFILR